MLAISSHSSQLFFIELLDPVMTAFSALTTITLLPLMTSLATLEHSLPEIIPAASITVTVTVAVVALACNYPHALTISMLLGKFFERNCVTAYSLDLGPCRA